MIDTVSCSKAERAINQSVDTEAKLPGRHVGRSVGSGSSSGSADDECDPAVMAATALSNDLHNVRFPRMSGIPPPSRGDMTEVQRTLQRHHGSSALDQTRQRLRDFKIIQGLHTSGQERPS